MEEHLYKFDLQNPTSGVQEMESINIGFAGVDFDKVTGELIAAVGMAVGTDGTDIVSWNMETNDRTMILSEPWDQLQVDSDNHVSGYLDSAASGLYWFGNYLAEAKVIDRSTGVKRTVLPLETYYGLGFWGHYLAVNNVGAWGDSIILCDLEAGGIMGTDGHVIPLDGPDGGVTDGGAADGGMDGGA